MSLVEYIYGRYRHSGSIYLVGSLKTDTFVTTTKTNIVFAVQVIIRDVLAVLIGFLCQVYM